MVRASAGLLVAYALAIVVALMSPSNDPQRGMAYGLMMMTLMLLALCVYPAVTLVARAVYLFVTRR